MPRPSKISLEQLEVSAARAFCEKGYMATSLQDLADDLGVRKAAIYYYANSKEELLFNISRDAMQRSIDGVRAVTEAGLSTEETMRQAIREHVLVLAQTLPEHRTMMTEMRSLGEMHRKHILEMRHEYETLFDKVLRRGEREGVFTVPDRKLILLALLGTVNWTVYWLDPSEGDVDTVATTLADFVMRSLTSGPTENDRQLTRRRGGNRSTGGPVGQRS